MSVRNEMEQLVREEVTRVKKLGDPDYAGCWCALCETDIVALALTLLPPLYCRQENQGHSAGLIRAGKIADAVQSALKRVALWPKHIAGSRPTSRDEIALINYTYEVCRAMVGPALAQSAARCSCEICSSDALAYALNRYPSKYGVTRAGRRSLHPTYVDFMRYELGMLVTQAARVVSANPKHTVEPPSPTWSS